MATYEIALPGGPARPPMAVVNHLPLAEVGELILFQGIVWRVNAIEAATTRRADQRLVVTRTTDAPQPGGIPG